MKRYLTLEEIQKESFKVLKKLDEICSKNNITYYLAFGTLIGAIRHKGYIPWDDDVDVWMPRESYERFADIIKQSNELNNYKLCDRQNTRNYVYNIKRFSNIEFEYTNIVENEKPFDCGVFVDVYPLDYCDNLEEAEKCESSIHKLSKLYSAYVGNSSDNLFNKIAKRILSIILKVLWGNEGYYHVDKLERNEISKLKAKEKKYLICFFSTSRVFPTKSEWFSSSIDYDFENVKLKVPVGYDSILKTIYGDYMKLPPENSRNPYHGYLISKK